MLDTALTAALQPLRFIQPTLTGDTAADVAALLDEPEAPLASLRFFAE